MQESAEKLWPAAQEFLRAMLNNSEIYNLWFAPLRASEVDGDTITLDVANEFSEVWLKDNYLDLLRNVISQASARPMSVKFRVTNSSVTLGRPVGPVDLDHVVEDSKPGAEETHTPERNGVAKELPFNPKNTFDTFVVGNNNTFAHAAAIAVAQQPGRSYNPLFLYGGVGLGKTHLLHAIGQHVAKNKKGARVTYVSTEKFTNEFIDAIQNNQLVRFRRRSEERRVGKEC